MAPGPPFPVFILAYLVNGFGISLLTAHTNGYIASQTRSPAIKMGILHASYGIGALVAPLVATQFASMPKWSFYFLTSLGIALVNVVVLSFVFRGRSQTDCLLEMEDPIAATTTSDDAASRGLFKQVMRRRVVHNVALFILIYVGLEVTIGGWTVTYVINERGGDASSGYISSGFFGGLFVGRIALLWINHVLGARRVIFIYAAFVLA
jgi:fucose permease